MALILNFPTDFIRFLIYLLAILISLFVMFYFLIKGRKSLLLFSYIILQVLVILGSINTILFELGYLWSKYQPLQAVAYFSYQHNLSFFFRFSMCLSWLIFCLLYTNSKIIKNRLLLVVCILIPSIVAYWWLTGNLGPSYYRFNPVFSWVKGTIAYLYLITGIILLVVFAIGLSSGYRRKHSIILALAMLVPLALSAPGTIQRIIQNPLFSTYFYDINEMLITLSLTMPIIAYATVKYGLNIMPMALKKLVDNLPQPIMVVDTFNKIMYFNSILKSGLKFMDEKVKMNAEITPFVTKLRSLSKDNQDNHQVLNAMLNQNELRFDGEICLEEMGESRTRVYFGVNIQPVQSNQELLGRIITFINVTDYKRLMNELNQKNMELQHANVELTKHAAITEELAIIKERNRFSRDAHDTLGHTMTMLIKLLEVGMITCRTDPGLTEEKLRQAIQVTREGLQEIKASIAGLSSEGLDAHNLTLVLKKMMADFRRNFKVEIMSSLCELPSGLRPRCIEAVYRACQEGITNAIRHGKAGRIVVVLRMDVGKLRLSIMDNGIGCAEIQKGGGLRGMEERVAELGGMIDYHSEAGNGFNINIELPLEASAHVENSNCG